MKADRAYLVTGAYLPALIAGLLVALLAAMVLAIAQGSVALPLGQVVDVLVGKATGREAEDALAQRIVWDMRMPRVLTALVVGVALTLAGAVLQAITRNPVADPYILGAGPGAAMGAVAVMTLPLGAWLSVSVPIAAFAGSMLALAAVLAFGQRGGMLSPTRMILTGVAVGYLCNALTNYLQLKTSPARLAGVLYWLLGSLSGASWDDVWVPAAFIVLAAVVLVAMWRTLDALTFGEETATSLGINVARSRLLLLVLSSVLTGSAVALAGGIVFVGLVAPHVARLLVGPSHSRLLPVSVLLGSVFLILVDLASRTLEAPNELPVSIFTAVIGAPFFLFLLRGEK